MARSILSNTNAKRSALPQPLLLRCYCHLRSDAANELFFLGVYLWEAPLLKSRDNITLKISDVVRGRNIFTPPLWITRSPGKCPSHPRQGRCVFVCRKKPTPTTNITNRTSKRIKPPLPRLGSFFSIEWFGIFARCSAKLNGKRLKKTFPFNLLALFDPR